MNSNFFKLKQKDRLLFFKYSVPCADTAVDRGKIKQQYLDEMIKAVSDGEDPGVGTENTFKVALGQLSLIAKEKGKTEIDEEVIREYFLFKHDPVVDSRYEEMRDFNPTTCRTYSGVVVLIEENKATIKQPHGIFTYRIDFLRGVSVGDIVVTHRDFVIEHLSKENAIKIWNQKEKYVENLQSNTF